MTKTELQEKMLDDFSIAFYQSNLSAMIDGHELDIIPPYIKHSLEQAIMELCEDLSEQVIETLGESNILKVIKKVKK